MEKGENLPKDLRNLAYTRGPEVRRLLVHELRRRLKKPLGEIVDVIFEDCYAEEDLASRAKQWAEAIDPDWTAEDLKRWAMKRRGLTR